MTSDLVDHDQYIDRRMQPTPYNRDVQRPLALDTSPDIEQRQVERWRAMSPAEKAALVSGLTIAAYELAMAGVRQRHPGASPREQFLRLAVITLGRELAGKVYPELEAIDPS